MFLVFIVVAVVAGVFHNVLPGPHHLRYSAYVIALAGAWFGAFCAAAFVQRTFVTMGWVTLVGSVIGAVSHLVIAEALAHAIVRSKQYEGDPGW